MMRVLLPTLFVHGCATSGVLDSTYDGGRAFGLTGEVSPEIEELDEPMVGMAWAWSHDGRVGASVEEMSTELLLFRYRADVPPPPVVLDSSEAIPEDWPGLASVDILVGVPVLFDAGGGPPEVAAGAVFDWMATGSGLSMMPGVADGYATVVVSPTTGSETLGESSAWTGHCALNAAIKGFTLYRRDTLDCGGWRPLATAGERTEFQGVGLVSGE